MELEKELYIPMGVKEKNELFNGFGKLEFLQSCVGSLLGSCLASILWMITQSVVITVVCVLSSIFGSILMTTKDLNHQSVVDQVGNMIRFMKEQQVYPYRYMDEWNM